MARRPYPCLVATLCLSRVVLSSLGADAVDPKGAEFFEKHVRPVLINRCYECHSAEKKVKGGLALDSKAAVLKGGESGPLLVAGDPEKSRLIEAVRYKNQDLQMPPKRPLPSAELKALEEWVRMGAPDPRTEAPVAVAKHGPRVIDVNEGRKFWSFAPIASPALPKVSNTAWVQSPVDAFVLARLQEKGLSPAPPADKPTLIRRATFDLVGLPPTPEEVEAFVRDDSPDAFGRVIERLLASPAYGERWARHWLDVARYADSNGMDENVALGNAWRYRDYVVRAFADDKPFDQFLIEQVAGDLLPQSDPAARTECLTATGFLALGAKVLAEPDVRKLEMDIIDEQIDTLGKAFLGMTLGCARCHEHKFDPITQEDYYALAAIFRSTRSLGEERTGAIKYWYEHSMATPGQLAARSEHEKAVKARRSELSSFLAKARAELKQELQSKAAEYLAAAACLSMEADFSEVQKLAASYGLRPRYLLTCRQYLERNKEHPVFAKWRDLVRTGGPDDVLRHYHKLFGDAGRALKSAQDASAAAARSGAKKQTGPQAKAIRPADPALAAAYDALNDIAGFLAIPDKDADAFDAATLAKVDRMKGEVMALEGKTPDLPAIMGVADGAVAKTLPVHIRGSHLTLGREIERGFPDVMRVSLARPVMPAKQSGRLELARWMASSDHPLTARVFVNRVWRWHFGKGIVGTTDNFGILGDKPSHPELLDWLARSFIENGWSVKELHRLIMKSSAYQMASTHPSAGTASSSPDPAMIDPENRLLWRANIQRLEAEQVRDAMLFVSGGLSQQVGGKTIPLRNREFVFNHTSTDRTKYESPRRALYLPIIRNHLYDMLEQFDYPDPTMPTGSRNSTVVAPQALIMLNSPVAMDAAARLGARVQAETGARGARACIHRAYALAYGRAPTSHEAERAEEIFLESAGRDQEGLTLLCQSLMAANEFIYVR